MRYPYCLKLAPTGGLNSPGARPPAHVLRRVISPTKKAANRTHLATHNNDVTNARAQQLERNLELVMKRVEHVLSDGGFEATLPGSCLDELDYMPLRLHASVDDALGDEGRERKDHFRTLMESVMETARNRFVVAGGVGEVVGATWGGEVLGSV